MIYTDVEGLDESGFRTYLEEYKTNYPGNIHAYTIDEIINYGKVRIVTFYEILKKLSILKYYDESIKKIFEVFQILKIVYKL